VIAYIDSSVVLRVIQGAPDALDAWSTLDPISSVLTTVECLRTIDRARLLPGADIEATARDRSAMIDVLRALPLAQISDSILERAADPFPTTLGTLDGIHLATALELREEHPDLAFATHDRQLATAAIAVGFEVLG
jgi:predicted nucleic acid-binding protein